jgi:hypothetical protein
LQSRLPVDVGQLSIRILSALNRSFGEWAEIFGDSVLATALVDRLLHHAVVIPIEGNSYRLREHANLLPEHLRNRAALQNSKPPEAKHGPGRPRKEAAAPTTG